MNWIKCSDRLPEDEQYYLIKDKEEGLLIGHYIADIESWSEKGTGCGCCCSSITITHWQPLPEPPKD